MLKSVFLSVLFSLLFAFVGVLLISVVYLIVKIVKIKKRYKEWGGGEDEE